MANRRKMIFLFVFVLALTQPFIIQAENIDRVLLAGTIKAAESLVFPSNKAKVSYNASAQHAHVSFTTPANYKRNLGDFFQRWRDNQWVVLQEFKRSNIRVKNVTVETNYVDGSGILRITHHAKHIDEYAKLPDDDLWLRTAESYQKRKGSIEWERVDY